MDMWIGFGLYVLCVGLDVTLDNFMPSLGHYCDPLAIAFVYTILKSKPNQDLKVEISKEFIVELNELKHMVWDLHLFLHRQHYRYRTVKPQAHADDTPAREANKVHRREMKQRRSFHGYPSEAWE